MGLWACKTVDLGKPGAAEACVSKGALVDASADPKTGTVVDNSDGSYVSSYIITKAGHYKLNIDFAGTGGADSPFLLTIMTEAADKSLTYAYGRLQGIAAGKTSEIYVQTRDRYGNFIRADNDVFPPGVVNGGTEDVQFELCLSLGDDSTAACAGGKVYSGVGVTISYSVGPQGNSINEDTGEPFYGLYQIVFFPFDPEPVIPRVLHGDKVADDQEAEPAIAVPCFFDTSRVASVYSLMDPGPELANMCASQAVSAAARRRGIHYAGQAPNVIISGGPDVESQRHEVLAQESSWSDAALSPTGFARDSNAGGGAPSMSTLRRAPSMVDQKQLRVTILQTFVAPDTQIIEFWLNFAPLICAAIGAFFAFCNISCNVLSRQKRLRLDRQQQGPDPPVTEIVSRDIMAAHGDHGPPQAEQPGHPVINHFLIEMLVRTAVPEHGMPVTD